MAEALAVLGIAANIAQFVGLSMELISAGKEAYNAVDGARDEHMELEIIVKEIKCLSDDFRVTRTTSSGGTRAMLKDEKAIRELADTCRPLADKLLRILDDLKVLKDARFRKLETVRQILRSAGKRKDIQDLKRRLLDIDGQLRKKVSMLLQQKNHSEVTFTLRALDDRYERMNANTSLKLDEMRAGLADRLDAQGKSNAGVSITLSELSSKLINLLENGRLVEHEQRQLGSLVFDSMKEREEKIKDAHKKTLSWVFKNPDTAFMDWLQAQNGIYWVKGKAGSGKSTLMKYVCDHEKTVEALEQWSGDLQLVTASYFFWNSGLSMQKSQKGLLQSLLYQVLLASPTLILEVCSGHHLNEPWDRKELFEALQKISTDTQLSAKYCFFVDGLDEYDGDDEDIINLLQELTSSPNIKSCVSSRPWNTFVDAFDNSKWKLALEDLTKDDMRKYVHNMLTENANFARLAKQDLRCNDLVPQIAEKAQGVWLWVFLVVRDLLRDVKGEEEYPFLQHRLDSFPVELEEYFANILSRIDRIYLEETARIFLIAVEAVRPLPVLAFKYLTMEQDDSEYAVKAAIRPIELEEAEHIYRKWRKLLNSRCRDLLEVNMNNSERTFLKYKVDFLHRTVRDFLRDNYQDELRKRAGDRFNATASLCKIPLALAKVLPESQNFREIVNPLFAIVDEMMYYTREVELRDGDSNSLVLDELDRVNAAHTGNARNHWTNARDPPKPKELFQEYGQCNYLALTIQSRLLLYMNEKLDANPDLLREKCGRPLLDYALRPKRVTPEELPYQLQYQNTNIDARVVRSLLSRGADPNQKLHIYGGQTVWALFLLSCYTNTDTDPQPLYDSWFEATELLIEYGADPNVQIKNPDNPEVMKVGKTARYKQNVLEETNPRYLTVSDVFRHIFTNDRARRLESRMKELAEQRRGQTSFFWKILGWT